MSTVAMHTVNFEPDDISDSSYNFACHGDRTSDCHTYPDCECEAWGPDHDHPSVPHENCWMQDWFENSGVEYMGDDCTKRAYSREPIAARSGEIKYEFELDYIAWWFA